MRISDTMTRDRRRDHGMGQSVLPDLERQIAVTRIILSVVAIVSVYVDPTRPAMTRWFPLTGGAFTIDAAALATMVGHFAYAVVMYEAVARGLGKAGSMGRVAATLDVLFAAAIALVTEGATSPAYAFFAFAILAVGCRAGFRVTAQVTVVAVALYLAVILLFTRYDTASAFIMRPAYLALTGYLIGYLGQQRLHCEQRAHELETRTERHGIARTLHDGYVQALAGTNLRLESCRELLRRGMVEQAFAEVTELQGGVRREYDSVRAYLRSLIDMQRRDTTAADVVRTRFTVSADFVASGVVVESVLAVVLEGVRNVLQHARATTAVVGVSASGDRIHITIDDDGVGFAPGKQPPWTIASRVAEIGGDVRVANGAARGAHLVVEIPVA